MKLKELLVQELPKRGGYPSGATQCVQDRDGKIKFFDSRDLSCDEGYWSGTPRGKFYCMPDHHIYGLRICEDHYSSVFTIDQYEAALAVSQKAEWDGNYPIKSGTDVEVHFDGDDCRVWTVFRVEYMRGDVVVLHDYRSDDVDAFSNQRLNFRPIRSEADKKREEAIDAMLSVFGSNAATGTATELKAIYGAIKSGQIVIE